MPCIGIYICITKHLYIFFSNKLTKLKIYLNKYTEICLYAKHFLIYKMIFYLVFMDIRVKPKKWHQLHLQPNIHSMLLISSLLLYIHLNFYHTHSLLLRFVIATTVVIWYGINYFFFRKSFGLLCDTSLEVSNLCKLFVRL